MFKVLESKHVTFNSNNISIDCKSGQPLGHHLLFIIIEVKKDGQADLWAPWLD